MSKTRFTYVKEDVYAIGNSLFFYVRQPEAYSWGNLGEYTCAFEAIDDFERRDRKNRNLCDRARHTLHNLRANLARPFEPTYCAALRQISEAILSGGLAPEQLRALAEHSLRLCHDGEVPKAKSKGEQDVKAASIPSKGPRHNAASVLDQRHVARPNPAPYQRTEARHREHAATRNPK